MEERSILPAGENRVNSSGIFVDPEMATSKNPSYIKTCVYREMRFDIFVDERSNSFYTIVDGGQNMYLGTFGTNYIKAITDYVDHKLNHIRSFSNNAELEWFQNGRFTDIRLIQSGRVLKVWLVVNRKLVQTDLICKEAEELLDKLNKIYC